MRIILAVLFAAFMIVQDAAAEWRPTFGLTQGIVVPGKKQTFGGQFGLRNEGMSMMLSYKHLLKEGKDVKSLGVEAGYTIGSKLFCRVFASPSFVWGDVTTLESVPNNTSVFSVYPNSWTLDISAGAEFGVALEFSEIPGHERLGIRVESLSDAFDGRLGEKGRNFFIGPFLGISF